MPVTMIDDVGDVRVIDESEAGAAAAAGWRPEAPEEAAARLEAEQYGTIGETVKGLGESALSGATMGLSDVAFAELGGEGYREARGARERQLGGLGTAAEIAGSAAPLLLSGGTAGVAGGAVRTIGAPVRGAAALGRAAESGVGAVARGVGLTGESMFGRGAVRGLELAAGGAVEGGLAGAGQALSEAALAPGGDYDRLAEKAWAGAKEGVVFGAISGGGLGFAGGVGSKAIERGMKSLTGSTGLKNMLENFATDRTVKALGARGTDIRRMGKTADAAEANMKQMAGDVLSGKLDDGTSIFKAGDKAEDVAERVAQARDEVAEKLGTLRTKVDDAAVDAAAIRARIDSDVLAPLRASDIPDVARRASKVDKALAKLDGEMSLGQLTKLRKDLDSVIYPKSTGAGLPPLPPAHAAELQQARGIIEGAIEDATERAVAVRAPELAGEYATLKQKFRSFKQAADISEKAKLQDLGNRALSPTDYLTGAAGTISAIASGGMGAIGGMLTGGAMSFAHKQVRERSSSVLAILADRVAKADLKMDKSIKGYFARAGDIRRAAIGEGAEAEVEQKTRIQKALGQKNTETQVDAYRRRLKELSSFNPQNLRDIGEASTVAPRATQASLTSLIRARDYLTKAAPTGLMGDDPLQPHLEQPIPDPVAMERFARAVMVVENPLSVLDDLQDGTITRDQVHTLKAVYPLLYEDVRSKVWNQIAETKTRLPYNARVRLGVLLDLPTDTSLNPARVAATQAIYKQAQEQAAKPPAPAAQANMTKQLTTPSQAAEFGLQDF